MLLFRRQPLNSLCTEIEINIAGSELEFVLVETCGVLCYTVLIVIVRTIIIVMYVEIFRYLILQMKLEMCFIADISTV